mgnify:CR=1 FL=1
MMAQVANVVQRYSSSERLRLGGTDADRRKLKVNGVLDLHQFFGWVGCGAGDRGGQGLKAVSGIGGDRWGTVGTWNHTRSHQP